MLKAPRYDLYLSGGRERGFCSLCNAAELLARKIQVHNASYILSLLEIYKVGAASGTSGEMVTV